MNERWTWTCCYDIFKTGWRRMWYWNWPGRRLMNMLWVREIPAWADERRILWNTFCCVKFKRTTTDNINNDKQIGITCYITVFLGSPCGPLRDLLQHLCLSIFGGHQRHRIICWPSPSKVTRRGGAEEAKMDKRLNNSIYAIFNWILNLLNRFKNLKLPLRSNYVPRVSCRWYTHVI